MRMRPETKRAMSRVEALAIMAEHLARAEYCTSIAADEKLPWWIRYQAAIAKDDCIDCARAAENYVRDHCQEG